MIAKGLYYLLTNDSTLGNLRLGGVEPVKVPQSPTWPLQTYNVVDGEHIQTLDNCNMMVKKVQVNTWADSYSSAVAIAARTAVVLIGYRGTVSSFVKVFNCILENEYDVYDKETENVYMISQTYKFFYINL